MVLLPFGVESQKNVNKKKSMTHRLGKKFFWRRNTSFVQRKSVFVDMKILGGRPISGADSVYVASLRSTNVLFA